MSSDESGTVVGAGPLPAISGCRRGRRVGCRVGNTGDPDFRTARPGHLWSVVYPRHQPQQPTDEANRGEDVAEVARHVVIELGASPKRQ